MTKNEIIDICGRQIMQMAVELCDRADLSGMIRNTCRKENPLIALKPNLLGPIPASQGATTHPEIVEGVVTYLRRQGFGNLIIMESSWVGDKTTDSLMVTGYDDLCRRLNVPFLDLQKDSGVPVDCCGMELNICKKALEADYLINLPVMKGHCQTLVTCALKNMKGCIPASEKRRFHRLGLHEPIGHLSAGIRQDFVLADAICPDLTFEDGGNPVELNRLVCAADPVLMDAYACAMIGHPIDAVEYISIAEECGVGHASPETALVTSLYEKNEGGCTTYIQGENIQSFHRGEGDYRKVLRVKEIVRDVDSCSACYGCLIPVLHRLEEEGLLDSLPRNLCIGQGWKGQKGRVGIGNCTSAFDVSLKGCPPSPEEMEIFLRELIRKKVAPGQAADA